MRLLVGLSLHCVLWSLLAAASPVAKFLDLATAGDTTLTKSGHSVQLRTSPLREVGAMLYFQIVEQLCRSPAEELFTHCLQSFKDKAKADPCLGEECESRAYATLEQSSEDETSKAMSGKAGVEVIRSSPAARILSHLYRRQNGNDDGNGGGTDNGNNDGNTGTGSSGSSNSSGLSKSDKIAIGIGVPSAVIALLGVIVACRSCGNRTY